MSPACSACARASPSRSMRPSACWRRWPPTASSTCSTAGWSGACRSRSASRAARAHRWRHLGLTLEAFPVPGKVALYLEDAAAGPGFGTREGDTLGLRIATPPPAPPSSTSPAAPPLTPVLADRLRGAALVLFDGTLYTDEEMIAQGLSTKTGMRMGHISMSGPRGVDRGLPRSSASGGASSCTSTIPTRSCARTAPSGRGRARRLGGRLRRHGDPPVSRPRAP